MKILIAGAGLGGLTAALCLQQSGHDVDVFEQSPKLAEIGAGIQLSANAVKVIQHLGLQSELEKVAVLPESIDIRLFASGESLHRVQLGKYYCNQHGAPYYHVHRADIHRILAKAFLALKPNGIHLGKAATGFSEKDDGVALKTNDGSILHGDLLIGADGIRSAIRKQITGDTPCNWTGNVAWRGTVPSSRLPKGFMDKVVSNFIGPGKHAVIYYLRNQELVNFVGVVANEHWKEEGWTIKSPWEELKSDYHGWHETVQMVIDAMDRDQCFRWALFNRLPIDNWSTQHVTLLGDSAHATLPFMASGAAMAIEDARVLDRALTQSSSVAAGLQLYQNNRLARTRRVQETSTMLGELYHLPNEQEFRNVFSNTKPEDTRLEDWLADYDPNTVVLS